MVVKGRIDGQNVVLEEPLPQDIPTDTAVKLVFDVGKRRPRNGSGSNLPSLAVLKARLRAGAGTSLRKAELNSLKLIGRPRI